MQTILHFNYFGKLSIQADSCIHILVKRLNELDTLFSVPHRVLSGMESHLFEVNEGQAAHLLLTLVAALAGPWPPISPTTQQEYSSLVILNAEIYFRTGLSGTFDQF